MEKLFRLGLFTTAVILVAASTASAGVDPCPFLPGDWANSYVLDMQEGTNGFVNPGLIVGFNPQPEPPAFQDMDLGDPTTPSIWVRNASTDVFRLVFGLTNTDPVDFTFSDAPDGSGHFEFDVFTPGAAPIHQFHVAMDFTTSSGGVPDRSSWVGFNPQPEPPALDMSGAFGFDFEFTSMSDAFLTFQILDSQGDAVTVLPEPSTMLLLGVGLAGLALTRVRRGRAFGQNRDVARR